MLGRRGLQHAVPEIEHEGLPRKSAKDLVRLAFQHSTAQDQVNRIQIALHDEMRLQMIARPIA